jgi:hypothetical protein
MADQRPPISLAELSKRVSEAVIHNIASFVDKEKIARAFLTAKDICGDSDMVTSHLETASEIIGEAVRDEVESKWLTSKVTEVLKDAGFTNPTQTMAGQRPSISLAALSEKVSWAVGSSLQNLVDNDEIAKTVLSGCYEDFKWYHIETAPATIEEAVGDTCDDDAIKETITKALKDAGITNEPPAAEPTNIDEKKIEEPVVAAIKAAMADPRPGSSISMDVTALREQILGLFPHRPSSRTANQLTDRTANARVIHRVYAHAFPQANFAEPEVIVLNYGENFLAAIVRARLFTDVNAKSDLIVTLQVMNCKNTLEVLEKLYEESRALLYRAYQSASVGKLGSWQALIFP